MGKKQNCLILFIGILALIFSACDTYEAEQESTVTRYCGACHAVPSPDILPTDRWDFALSYMGFYLGVKDYESLENMPPLVLQNLRSKERVLRTYGMIPDVQVVTDEEWEKIRAYFRDNAPASPLPQTNKPEVIDQLPGFSIHYPEYQPTGAVITWIEIDEKQIQIANSTSAEIISLNHALEVSDSAQGLPLIVSSHKGDSSQLFLSIGDLMGGNVAIPKGFLSSLNNDWEGTPGILINPLHRPADFLVEDLNADGQMEILIANFGDLSGSLEIFGLSRGKWQSQKVLANRPGCVKIQTHDFNGDGLKDVIALFTHEKENFTIFYQTADGSFTSEVIIEKHSAFGHTYFELADFNDDGFADILAVNGDSDADPYNTPKNFHGARIYLNDGENQFEESFFYPMYGMHFAKAGDFDNDGDLDIAGTAFMADFHEDNPEQFVYLQNTGSMNFQPYTRTDIGDGRWMVMDIGDYDADGDIDIALGAGNIPLGMAISYPDKVEFFEENGKALLILENTLVD